MTETVNYVAVLDDLESRLWAGNAWTSEWPKEREELVAAIQSLERLRKTIAVPAGVATTDATSSTLSSSPAAGAECVTRGPDSPSVSGGSPRGPEPTQ
jgi:hypothetical protein